MRPLSLSWLSACSLGLAFALLPSQSLIAAANEAARQTSTPAPVKPKRYHLHSTIGLLEAVELTLNRSAVIQVQEMQTEVGRGTVVTREGSFDTHFTGTGSHGATRTPILTPPATGPAPTPIVIPLTDLTTGQIVPGLGVVIPNAPPAPGPQVFVQNNSGFDIGLSKTLPNGAEVGAEAIYSRSNMLNGGPIFNTSELRLTLNVPLLRMFTPSDQWSALAAAKIDYRASLLTERHVVTEAVLQTVRAYWALRAAQEQYIFLKRSEQTAISLRKIISSLIKGEERAKAEIYQADAHVAEQATQRAAAEQTLFQARQQLGLAMGLDEEDLKVAPYAGEPFPAARDLDRSRTVQDRLIADSVLLRADYQASLKGEQSARVLLDAARRNLLPPVNFQIRASYFGGDIGSRFENFTNSFSKNETGVSVTGQLSFDWPLENRVARGLLIQSSANYATTGIRTDDLRRNIVSGILLSVDFLVSGGQQLQEATAAADAYAKAVENERLKYTNGESTVVDVITIEDRYIQSLLTAVSANQQVASAYAQLRFESGTMFPENGSRLTLRRDVLVSVPEVPR